MDEQKKKLIFIVEDDPFVLRIYQRKFAKEGFEVALATNGKEALERMKDTAPDLVLLDLVMPHMDGFELIADLKKDVKLKQIPIIVLTNLRQEKDIQRVKDMDVADYLVKADTSIHAVIERVKEVLART